MRDNTIYNPVSTNRTKSRLITRLFIYATKLALTVWAVFLSQSVLSMICVNPTSTVKISGPVLANSLKNSFTMAFNDENFTDYRIYQSSNITELASQIQEMSNGTCSVVLGLISSQDCLVSGPILQKNKTIAISSSCVNSKIKQFFPYVYTATPTLQHYSQAIASKLNQDDNTGMIYAFYQPTDIYSTTGYQSFKHYIKKPVTEVPINTLGGFHLKDPPINNNQPTTIIFFTYPLISAQILINLDSHNLINNKTDIIGDTSWIFELSALKPIESILRKSNSAVTQSIVSLRLIASTPFYAQFKKLQQRPPDVIEAISYDITRFATQCYKQTTAKGEFNNNDFLTCLRTTEYQGASGPMTFEYDSPFAVRKTHIVNILSWL